MAQEVDFEPSEDLERLVQGTEAHWIERSGGSVCDGRDRLCQAEKGVRLGRAKALAVRLWEACERAVEKAQTFPIRFAQDLRSSAPYHPIACCSARWTGLRS
jgi:hypothetical protein